MVVSGIVAVGRTGGTILGTTTGFLAASPAGFHATDMPTQIQMGHRSGFTQPDPDLK